jgi:hypothetical protein
MARYFFFGVDFEYDYVIAILFTVSFLIGGGLQQKRYLSNAGDNSNHSLDFSRIGICILYLWVLLAAAISVKYGLHNRRIGTENAAELFGNMPILELILFRSLEISLPMLLSVPLIRYFEGGQIRYRDKCTAIVLLTPIFFLGTLSSRISTLLFCVVILAIVQNKIPQHLIRGFVVKLIFIGALIFAIVQTSRLSEETRPLTQYFSAEVVQRLDGLELVSRVVDIHGLNVFGVNFIAVQNPIISHLSFLEESSRLKRLGLTSVKSVVLDNEIGSSLRDYNSFIVLDIFYVSGMMGIMIFGLMLGRICRLIDRTIYLNKSRVILVVSIAVAMNITILERELFSILFSVTRDFFILLIFSYVLLVRSVKRNEAN